MIYIREILQAFPLIIYAGTGVATIITQSKLILYFLIGILIFGSFMNHILKYSFSNLFPDAEWGKRPEDRPNTGCGYFDKCDGGKAQTYGFPSGHSQTMAFFAIFWTLYILDTNSNKNSADTILKILAIWLITLSVAISRIHVKCHTVVQVVAGLMIGIGFGYGYYKLVKKEILKNNFNSKF